MWKELFHSWHIYEIIVFGLIIWNYQPYDGTYNFWSKKRLGTQKINHKFKLLTSCFRPISWHEFSFFSLLQIYFIAEHILSSYKNMYRMNFLPFLFLLFMCSQYKKCSFVVKLSLLFSWISFIRYLPGFKISCI